MEKPCWCPIDWAQTWRQEIKENILHLCIFAKKAIALSLRSQYRHTQTSFPMLSLFKTVKTSQEKTLFEHDSLVTQPSWCHLWRKSRKFNRLNFNHKWYYLARNFLKICFYITFLWWPSKFSRHSEYNDVTRKPTIKIANHLCNLFSLSETSRNGDRLYLWWSDFCLIAVWQQPYRSLSKTSVEGWRRILWSLVGGC